MNEDLTIAAIVSSGVVQAELKKELIKLQRFPDVSYLCNLIIHDGDTDGIGIIWSAWKIYDQVFRFEECFDQSYENHLEDLSDISFMDDEFGYFYLFD
ncbi:unnamed protein product [Brugia pahangi]|uniref:ABM domain-containing protein n=1 Tax=Brugia pahangi TaxID=6280 RepID=A0A0N4TI12_BRUPA|nr:unnamed protein product [Brugia pahangi]